MTTTTFPGDGYVLCSSEQDVLRAMGVLCQVEYLILDCEGRNLGREDGVLSLVCVGTPYDDVYVFDAVTLRRGTATMDALLDLLSNKAVIKIMWDGRMDYLEILLTFGIHIDGVLDLQIAEVVSRFAVRGETEDDHIRRLQNSFFGFTLVRSIPHMFKDVHLVIGMQKCLDMLGLGDRFQKDPVVQAMHSANQTHRWLERPLEPRLAAYAAQDIRLLGVLYDTFCKLGWILPSHRPGLVAHSARYVSLFQTREASVAYSRRRAWTVLPLDILDEPHGTLYPCGMCQRALSKHCFLLGSIGRLEYHHRYCRTCWVVCEKRREDVRSPDKWVPIWESLIDTPAYITSASR
ncbi:hypothetical protein CALVIDRAFT_519588 [Calocera viscosa TUFC12733]|uniref:3'-5' exonuclease domain-containing protein n=1 Tax=Calocera viscosa (strain TUFC12733) TaxID=1330018 RepID=A0A167IVL3_CALVF|nr:hypothetical protein CALVIDRAFT_519588 [Calocera viscosa TUFC12733]